MHPLSCIEKVDEISKSVKLHDISAANYAKLSHAIWLYSPSHTSYLAPAQLRPLNNSSHSIPRSGCQRLVPGSYILASILKVSQCQYPCSLSVAWPWNNGKKVSRWGVAEIQKMTPSTTGRCKQGSGDSRPM